MVPEVPATVSALTEPAASFVSARNELVPASVDIMRTTIERGFGSAPTELASAMDIMEKLAHQMVQ